MLIYLVRHAHAVEGKDDAARALSRKGRDQIRVVAKFLRAGEAWNTREFWHSPMVRSVDTAKLLGKRLKVRGTFTLVSGLLHEDDPKIMAKKLNRLRRTIAIVGHEPHLSALATLLLTGSAQPPRVVLKKCAVLALERKGRRWSVRWLVSPEIISTAGR
jgi:phosphohistidine phosphatase